MIERPRPALFQRLERNVISADRFDATLEWLMGGARTAEQSGDVLGRLCERLVDAGLPLFRVGVFVRTLHPDVYGRSFIWRAGREVAVGEADFNLPETEEFQTSPLTTMLNTGKMVRHRLNEMNDSSSLVLEELRAEGITDYVAFPIVFTDGSKHGISLQTKEPKGFSETDIAALTRLVPPLARVAEVRAWQRTTMTLLNTYVGVRAGERILAGQIRRGHTDLLHAVIWLSDLRGFTALSDRLPPILMVDLLNRYFDCQVPAIVQAGGEVLKFMGDGLLAIFPTADDGEDEAEVCTRALVAAREARTAVRNLSFATLGGRTEGVNFGLALHVGDVLYGNIGGANRLDFTCIGPAVNLAARIEKLASSLGRTILASRDFARHAADDWQDIGEFSVAGLARPQRVFGLLDEMPG